MKNILISALLMEAHIYTTVTACPCTYITQFAVPGKKNRIMERRLQKGFQIGFVERILTEAMEGNKEPRDVFSKIAQAIHNRSSSQSKKKDWNAMVRRNTIVRDPIGSSSEADLQRSRQSLRQHIVTNRTALLSMDAEKLVEYNPKLSALTPATRVAYAKFKVANLTQKAHKADENVIEKSNDASISDAMCETNGSYDCQPENKTSQTDTTKPPSSVVPRETSGPSCVGAAAAPVELPPQELSAHADTKPENTATASVTDVHTSPSSVREDFRTRTPIQEVEEEKHAEDSKETEDKRGEKINTETLEPSSTETVPLKKAPMKTGGKSKVSGETLTGWL
jgi:transient receptor potential cation channel subfamily C